MVAKGFFWLGAMREWSRPCFLRRGEANGPLRRGRIAGQHAPGDEGIAPFGLVWIRETVGGIERSILSVGEADGPDERQGSAG